MRCPGASRVRGAHVARAALMLMASSRSRPGICCPISMTYAAVPALRRQPDIATEWLARFTSLDYDPRPCPPRRKAARSAAWR